MKPSLHASLNNLMLITNDLISLWLAWYIQIFITVNIVPWYFHHHDFVPLFTPFIPFGPRRSYLVKISLMVLDCIGYLIANLVCWKPNSRKHPKGKFNKRWHSVNWELQVTCLKIYTWWRDAGKSGKPSILHPYISISFLYSKYCNPSFLRLTHVEYHYKISFYSSSLTCMHTLKEIYQFFSFKIKAFLLQFLVSLFPKQSPDQKCINIFQRPNFDHL